MSTALYRAYRPQKFAEVAGQDSAVGVLKKELATDRTAHAYLFSGARGCGKTTAARLMAKALNCANPTDGYEPCCVCQSCVSITNGENLDVIEIDGASNNGVEEIRELKTHVALAPFGSRLKIYIIDEVHMLSTAAFNALLKTLEEPPAHVVFILATTEPHKVPVTIRSRCQHIPFHRISPQNISERLKIVCKSENLEFEDEALWEIARNADGALRDALSLLDQIASLGKGKILIDDVSELMGGGSLPTLERWLCAWRDGDESSFSTIDEMFRRGASPQRILEELFSLARNLWVARNWGKKSLEGLDISSSEREYLEKESTNWDIKPLERLMLFLSKLIPSARVGMRTDVLVGIIMARRGEIMNGLEESTPTYAPTPAISRPPVSIPAAPAPVPALKFEPKLSAPKEKIEIAPGTEISEAEADVFTQKIKDKNFALYCALLWAKITKSDSEDKNFCVRVSDEYIFYALSGGKNPSLIASILKENYPDFRVFINCGSLAHECTVMFKSPEVKIAKKAAAKPLEATTEETEETDVTDVTKKVGDDKPNAVGVVQNALKFMRGEVLIHRTQQKKTSEELAESEGEVSVGG